MVVMISHEINSLIIFVSLPFSSQMYFGNHSRRDMNSGSIWLHSSQPDVDDVGEVDTDPDKDIDPDSEDTTVDSDPDGLNLPELEFTMNGSKNGDEEVDDDDEVEEEDDIQMDEDDCSDELEPQFKKKKTK